MYRAVLLFLITVLLPFTLQAQVDDGKAAFDRGEFVRAVNILSEEVAERPSAEAYLYLGMSYGRMREFVRAEEVLRQGAERYPGDPRFFNEIANNHLASNAVQSFARLRTRVRRRNQKRPRSRWSNGQE